MLMFLQFAAALLLPTTLVFTVTGGLGDVWLTQANLVAGAISVVLTVGFIAAILVMRRRRARRRREPDREES